MKVQLAYLFSKNPKIGSKLISWGTFRLAKEIKDTPSHIAILVNQKWVFESTLASGIRVVSYKDWLTINTQTYSIPTDSIDYEIIKQLFKSLKDKKYDYWGIAYFAWRIVLNMCFNAKMPTINKWQSNNKYFCSEVAGKLSNIDCQMLSPVELLVRLKH